ncbi:hypothetical protein GTG28_20015 [Vibrio sp. OCN044]|uniref:Thioesterase n=1 Tax=Vibrio tetraodonis subsp. pristinus TaxID=2695891 RepID=A0A6L8LZJ9_9VIBR|nr:thioesterase family protein [Vibrio tetraodonis]MYM61497.1 hypothetical protein [Vibrio tetraodonis subsp. pristinus]
MKITEFIKTFDVRFTDLNAGNHLSNHMFLAYITDHLSCYLNEHGWSLGNIYGYSTLLTEVSIKFKREVFEFDQVTLRISETNIKSRKLSIHFTATVKDKIVATSVHDYSLMKDNRISSISEDVTKLFLI